ncbi:MAG TPA: LCP family protein [Solirubrobacteraceae bacterium]|nr:LCP family protein [Solirubrobacteraceae bacterium]
MNAAIPPTRPPTSGAPPQSSMVPEPPQQRWWLAKRVLLGALGVVLVSGAATAVLALNEVGGVVEALRESKHVKLAANVLAPTSRGGPQTLLLVGNDERPPPKSNPFGRVLPHSNEMLLVRIDPSKPTISMMSIPRELQVTFTTPRGVVETNRINSAYTYGGTELMTKTIKNLLGISINHVFVLTFKKFRRAVDEVGCLYMTVDRRYYHANEPGGEQYFEINLQPGYQRLCGKGALEFVSNRHEDTSLLRDARDQRLLLELKAQYGPSLFENRQAFEKILGRAVETDIHSTSQVLDLLALLVEAQGKPVRQVPFQVTLLKTYDTASSQQIHESVENFLGGTAAIAKGKVNASLRTARPHHHRGGAPPLNLTSTPASELAEARSAAPNLPFPLEYPRARETFAGALADKLRVYDIRDQRGHIEPAYVIVIEKASLGQFYDVQGTSWADPPLLSNPGASIHVGSRTYDLYYAGEQIRTIAWHEDGAAYWIQNTLTNAVQPREMLAMAIETTSVISGASATPPVIGSLANLHVPPHRVQATSKVTKLGALLAVAVLVPLLALAAWLLYRRRELEELRTEVSRAMTLEAHQRERLANPPRGAGSRTAAGAHAVAPAQPAGSAPPAGPAAQRPTPAQPAEAPQPAAQPPATDATLVGASLSSVGDKALAGELPGGLDNGDVVGRQDDV